MLRTKLPIFSILLFLVSGSELFGQSACTTLGQNPATAFPVCGTAVFQQDSVPICSSVDLYVPGCSIYGDTLTQYQNKNPFWYKFTCFESGTLNFVIIPNEPDEDYDWQLYDITGHNPDDVYTDTTTIVTGNWAGTYDSTGANATGVNYIQCASDPSAGAPTFALSPNLVQGHNYLLLVSHFSDTQRGYSLSFGGGTAVITDTLPPHMNAVTRATCDGTKMLLKLNKRMRCNSLAPNGSDFVLNPPIATILSATGFGCTNGFDMDSVLLTFSAPLPVGNYDLIARNGSDANTVVDLCGNGIPVGETIPFQVLNPLPVPFDSLNNNKCSTDSLVLVFSDLIKCSSVAPDGSDFYVTGTYPVAIVNAEPVICSSGLSRQIIVRFNTTLIQPGNFQIILRVGSDGNTILSECDTPSVAGSAIPFRILAKPVADFGFPPSVCLPNAAVTFANRSDISDGTGNTLQYLWNFDDPASGRFNFSAQKTPTHVYNNTGPFNVRLRVTSSGGCVDSTAILLNSIHPQPIVNFGISKNEICLGDAVFLTDSTNSLDGITTEWYWDLGDGSTRDTRNVLYIYAADQSYDISLYTVNSHGCKSELLKKTVTVYPYPTADAGPDRVMLEGAVTTIQAAATGLNLQYAWTPWDYLYDASLLKPKVINPKFDILYTLTVTGPGRCIATDEMFIDVLKIPLIPNTFSPNSDGINDLWKIQYLDEYKNSLVQVFTRAGQKVFECRGSYKAWDGSYKGKELPMDTYYYIIEPGNGRDPVTGYVTLIK
ncbi:MAG: PKD domain-containing protein [Ferruginibacter sp.]